MPIGGGFTDLRQAAQRAPFDVNSSKFGIFGDDFARTTLNPTGAIPYYTSTVGQGTGTNVIAASKDRLSMTTTGANGDNQELRLDELVFRRSAVDPILDSRTIFNIDIVFTLGQTTNTNFFIGIVGASVASLTALPGTSVSMGVQFNDGASANFFLTSGDGGAQTTTDTTAAANTTNFFRLNINWTGKNAAVISLFDEGTVGNPTVSSTFLKSQTVTATGSTIGMNFRAFLKTTATATKAVTIWGWNASMT